MARRYTVSLVVIICFLLIDPAGLMAQRYKEKEDPEEENYIVDPDAYNESPDFDFILDMIPDSNPDKKKLKSIAVVDATSIAPGVDRDLMDIEGAEGSAEIGKGIGACLAAVTAKITGIVSVDNVMDVCSNKDAAKKALDMVNKAWKELFKKVEKQLK